MAAITRLLREGGGDGGCGGNRWIAPWMESAKASSWATSDKGISSPEGAARCSIERTSSLPLRRRYRLESPHPCRSEEPRSNWPGLSWPERFRAAVPTPKTVLLSTKHTGPLFLEQSNKCGNDQDYTPKLESHKVIDAKLFML